MPVNNAIPFFVIIEMGRYAIMPVWFGNSVKYLKYRYLCMTDKDERAYFRTAGDARMAAKGNSWEYMGKC